MQVYQSPDLVRSSLGVNPRNKVFRQYAYKLVDTNLGRVPITKCMETSGNLKCFVYCIQAAAFRVP